ncbi:MAG: CpsB/CapC family capsule biosynthesis tyrosine phosphatase, partial [Bacillota bacterium]
MKGYVDIHVHILPGFDDGARTEDQAVIMADIASKSGTMKVVATPHIDPSGLAPNCSKAQSVRETTL